MSQRILLVGGRSKAKSLILSLIAKGYEVTVINSNVDDCRKLAEIDKLTVFHGDGTKAFVLEDANAEEADIAIALTAKDEDNLVIAELCKNRFKIKKVVSLLSDAKKTEFFYRMGVDSVVCANSILANVIEHHAFVDKFANITAIQDGKAQLIEVKILDDSPIIGKQLWQINLPKEVIVGCILRTDSTMIPQGDTEIQNKDTLVIICKSGQEKATIEKLTGKAPSL